MRHRDLYRNPDRRRALSLLLWPTEKSRASREILVAGCGTSQAAIHALREPDARVTAIDISETSLRHTRDLQRKYGLRNLDLHRLAIEQVRELGQMTRGSALAGPFVWHARHGASAVTGAV